MKPIVPTTLLLTAALSATFLLSACEGNAKMRKMTNHELASKHSSCVRKNPSSPGRVTACENIRKECKRRRDNDNYAC